MATRRVLRAAFDFGSGATKLCVALCDDARTSPSVRVLYEREVEVLLGHNVSVAANGERVISDGALRKLMDTSAKLKELVDKLHLEHPGCPLEVTGVCTAVFRETVNGPPTLDALKKLLRCEHIRILPQADEGIVGFLTGVVAAQDRDLLPRAAALRPRVAVWDSGGSSFQISVGPAQSDSLPKLELCVEGNWGSSKAVRALAVDVKRLAASQSPNPVTVAEATALRRHIDSALVNDGILPAEKLNVLTSVAPEGATPITWIGIGGPTSAFRMAWKSLGAPTDGVISAAALQSRMESDLCGRSDAQLREAGFPQESMVVAKICLVLTVMHRIKLPAFTFVPTTGSTLGIIAHPGLWQQRSAPQSTSQQPVSSRL